MQEYLYEVPVNGTRIPEMRKVVKETPQDVYLRGSCRYSCAQINNV